MMMMTMMMAHVNANCRFLLSPTSSCALQQRLNTGPGPGTRGGNTAFTSTQNSFFFSSKLSNKHRFSIPPIPIPIPRRRITTSSNSSSSSGGSPNPDDASTQTKKASFGYSRKDVILIGVGLTLLGIALKTGLEFGGVDPLQAGNVVQLVLVLGLTLGWISTYIFRVSNKEMTYAQQLRDYESKVMEKRLESLTEAELQLLLQEVEEEKTR